MNTYTHKPVHISRQDAFQPGFAGQGFSPTPYPGLENSFDNFGGSYLPAVQAPAQSSTGGLLGNLPIKEIQGFVTKMGGIDGIMGTMVKMQKFMKTFQSMGPMLKLLMSSFGGKSAKTASGEEYRPSSRRRRRSHKRRSSYRRRRPISKTYKRRVNTAAASKVPYRPSQR